MTNMTLEEWQEIARRSTSGDQVWDILASWEADREKLKKQLALADAVCERLSTQVNQSDVFWLWNTVQRAFDSWKKYQEIIK